MSHSRRQDRQPRKFHRHLAAPQQTSAPPELRLTPDWTLLWGDDFNVSNLDTLRWWTRYVYEGGYLNWLNDEQQRYGESGNHVMQNPGCSLYALPRGSGEYWPSGMIRSKALVPLASGNAYYCECQGRVPGGRGVWPAFWCAASEAVPGDDSSAMWPPELDMMEIVNNGVEDTTWQLHCGGQVIDWDRNPQRYTWTWATEGWDGMWAFWWAPYDFAQGTHSWGLYYKRPEFIFYCDRRPILAGTYDWVFDDGRAAPPAYLFANLAIGGSWAGRHGVDELAFPQAFHLDYIRVWERVPQSTIGHDLMPTGG